MLRPAHKKLGFTIVEMLIVIVLVGVLATIGTLSWNGIRERADSTKITNSLTAYVNAFTLYASQEGHYPPVPNTEGYCLGASSIPAAKTQELLPTLSLPSTILGEPARYCGILETANPNKDTVWAAYPNLDKALGSVARVDDSLSDSANGYLLEDYYGGIFASYVETDATLGLYQVFIGAFYRQNDTCPTGITGAQGEGEAEFSDPDMPVKTCMYRLDKSYPAEMTGESWPPY